MDYIADLHLHSKYSRAVSKDMVLPIMSKYAKQKGINILTASDWTHGLWFKEIRSQLEEAGEGVYKLKSQISNIKSQINTNEQREPLFLLSTEIASIYTQGGKLRRIHNLVFAPNFETAEKINKELIRRGCNLLSDGRPIIGISSKNLLELILSVDQRAMLIPCHAWTPHFGVYGSASGFDSLDEAFGELAPNIYAIETGLSSDPEMNWQMEELENRSILSFSDAHSPAKMGREATVFIIQNSESKIQNENSIHSVSSGQESQISNRSISYDDIAAAIKRDPKANLKIGYTIEFYPEEGKYHFSGHRDCKVVFGPEEIKAKGNTCPVCKKRLTEGVLYRLQILGKGTSNVEEKISPHGIKWYTDKTKHHPPYVKLVPLLEIVAEGLESTVSSQKVRGVFDSLCSEFESEIEVLLKTPIAEIQKIAGPKIAEGVKLVRDGNIVIDPGYDGEYGKVRIWKEEAQSENLKKQNNNEEKAQLGLF